MHRTEPSRLQSLSLQLSDKIAQMVDNNERLLEFRGYQGGGGGGGGWRGRDRGGGGWQGDRDRDYGGRGGGSLLLPSFIADRDGRRVKTGFMAAACVLLAVVGLLSYLVGVVAIQFQKRHEILTDINVFDSNYTKHTFSSNSNT